MHEYVGHKKDHYFFGKLKLWESVNNFETVLYTFYHLVK